jgi:hypothetical protein
MPPPLLLLQELQDALKQCISDFADAILRLLATWIAVAEWHSCAWGRASCKTPAAVVQARDIDPMLFRLTAAMISAVDFGVAPSVMMLIPVHDT